jgi:hypothetical protein
MEPDGTERNLGSVPITVKELFKRTKFVTLMNLIQGTERCYFYESYYKLLHK